VGKEQGLGLRGRQLGQEIGARSGQALPWWLVHLELDDHMLRRGRRLLRVELGRQGTEVAQVLAVDPALEFVTRDTPAQVNQVLGIRSILAPWVERLLKRLRRFAENVRGRNPTFPPWVESIARVLEVAAIILACIVVVLILLWPLLPLVLVGSIHYLRPTMASETTRLLIVEIRVSWGYLLYQVQQHIQVVYGMTELLVGAIGCWLSLGRLETIEGKWSALFGIAGGVYILIRGFENFHVGYRARQQRTPQVACPEAMTGQPAA
jgi:hypothetical protein